MLKQLIVSILVIGLVGGPAIIDLSGQTLTTKALKVKAKAEERARKQSRTRIKLLSDATYVGVVSDAGDSSFTITDKGGSKHTIQYAEVKSIGGTGWGSRAKLGLGIGIGAGVVLAVLAAIVTSDN